MCPQRISIIFHFSVGIPRFYHNKTKPNATQPSSVHLERSLRSCIAPFRTIESFHFFFVKSESFVKRLVCACVSTRLLTLPKALNKCSRLYYIYVWQLIIVTQHTKIGSNEEENEKNKQTIKQNESCVRES